MKVFGNKFLDVVNTLCNYIVLNLVFLATCVPVFTIGSALVSLYTVTMREARGEYGYLVRPYLTEFRKNLKRGTGMWAIIAGVAALGIFGIAFWYSLGSAVSGAAMVILIIVLIMIFAAAQYAFPLLARFDDTVKQTLKNAMGLAFSELKYTILLAGIDLLVVSLAYVASPVRIILLIFGFAFTALLKAHILIKVFEPYENR